MNSKIGGPGWDRTNDQPIMSPTWALLGITVVCLLGIASAVVPAQLNLWRLSSARQRGSATRTTPPPQSLDR
jgi:hypothetical protein